MPQEKPMGSHGILPLIRSAVLWNVQKKNVAPPTIFISPQDLLDGIQNGIEVGRALASL